MLKRKMLYSVACMSLLAASLLAGCSGSDSGTTNPDNTIPGATANVNAITTASADGNVQASVGGVTINSPPVVTFALSDENGQPLDPNTLLSDSTNSIRFYIARLDATGNYQNYIAGKDKNAALTGYPRFDGELFDATTGKATNKNAGTFATVKPGVYTYTFATDIKDSTKTYKNLAYDATKTHTVAIQIVRNTTKNGKALKQVSNPFINFRPDGGATVPVREVVSTSACNQCHGKLAVHGGSRMDVALCILCHNPGVAFVGSGVTVEFKTMIHKIHMGKNLPSQKLKQSGFFAESKYKNFSTVTLPLKSADSDGTPMDCVKCHVLGKDTLGRTYGVGVDKYKVATKANCGTCHDATSFAGEATLTVDGKSVTVPATVSASGGPHSGDTQADDSKCATCHPTSGSDYDTSVTGAHTIWEKSTTNPGFRAKVLSASNVGPLQTPIVTFQVTDAAGNRVALDTTNASSGVKQSISIWMAIKPKGYADYVNAPPYPNATPADATTSYAFEATPNQGRIIPVLVTGSTSANAGAIAAVNVSGAVVETPANSGKYVFDISKIPSGSYAARNNASKLRPVLPPLTGEYKNGATVAFYIIASRTDVETTRRNVKKNFSIKAPGSEPVYYDLETGAVAAASESRRVVVDQNKCTSCHGNYIPGHNGSYTVLCVACHNSNNNDRNFAMLIHKAHTGEGQAAGKSIDYALFSTFKYPGSLLRCNACHVEDNPAPVSNGYPSFTKFNNFSSNRIPSAAQACISCHDTTSNAGAAVTHAKTKAASFIYKPATATSAASVTDVVCTSCHSDIFRSIGHQLPN